MIAKLKKYFFKQIFHGISMCKTDTSSDVVDGMGHEGSESSRQPKFSIPIPESPLSPWSYPLIFPPW